MLSVLLRQQGYEASSAYGSQGYGSNYGEQGYGHGAAQKSAYGSQGDAYGGAVGDYGQPAARAKQPATGPGGAHAGYGQGAAGYSQGSDSGYGQAPAGQKRSADAYGGNQGQVRNAIAFLCIQTAACFTPHFRALPCILMMLAAPSLSVPTAACLCANLGIPHGPVGNIYCHTTTYEQSTCRESCRRADLYTWSMMFFYQINS